MTLPCLLFGLAETSGIVVVEVDPGSPAAEADVQPGDIILEIDHEKVEDLDYLIRMIRGHKKGDTILFLVKRHGSSIYITIKLE